MDERLEVWEGVAPAWERHRARLFDTTRAVSDWLVDAVDPGLGRTILEITAGTGETSFLAAARGGTIICSDLARGMVDAANRQAQGRSLANVECRVLDAQRLDLPDESVDGVMSRYGLMLVPDPVSAFSEVHRVLRPSRRMAYAVWGPPASNLWVVLLGLSVIQHGHELGGDPYEPGGMFSLSAAERNEEYLEKAGFTNLEVREIPISMEYGSFDEYWSFQTEIAGPIARVLGSLPAEHVAGIRDTARTLVADHVRDDGSIGFDSLTVAVRADRPQR